MCLTVPGRVLSVAEETPEVRSARVDFGGTVRTANLTYTPEVRPGDFVIVQAGFAVRKLSEAEAREALEYHRQLQGLARAASAATAAGEVP